MSLHQVTWKSQLLGRHVPLWAIVPDNAPPPYAVFYLLHGLSDDHSIWLRRTSLERHVERYPLVVVMPDGERGWYTDNADGPAYGQHLAEELPAFVDRVFPVKRTRAGRCIGGLSMGGYGALRTALAHPDRYVSASGHSGAYFVWAEKAGRIPPAEHLRVFGKRPAGSHHDVLALARRAKRRGLLPALHVDCGTEDFLLDHNRRLHAGLERLGVPHTYAEYPGAHTWDYWDLHVQEALAFHARHLRLKVAG